MTTKKDDNEGGVGISDVFKKALSLGVGAAFMTEDAIKGIIKDLPFPKEVLNGLVQNAKNIKEDIAGKVGDEVKNYLSKIDTKKITHDVLENYDIEVSAKFKFTKKDDKK